MPDIYQGSELWDLNLVDPDNRRPVDFECRREALRALRKQWDGGMIAADVTRLLDAWPSGRVKLFVTWRILNARKSLPAVFADGAYKPVEVEGPRADNVCCFLRTHGEDVVLVVVPRLIEPWVGRPECGEWPVGAPAWDGTCLILQQHETTTGLQALRNVFTGEALPAGTLDADGRAVRLNLAELLSVFPVGVWA